MISKKYLLIIIISGEKSMHFTKCAVLAWDFYKWNSRWADRVQMFGMFLALYGNICYNVVSLTAARHYYNAERKIVTMIYTTEVQHMCPVAKGAYHGPAPIPEEGKWVQAKEISDISGFTHGIGWCAPQQGACKLTLNVKNGIIE